MADRLNDTDPQSPRALGSKTDPGLGDAPAIVALRTGATPVPPETTPAPGSPSPGSPSPGSASIEELLDGITGPRPPSSSRPSRRSGPRPAAAMSDSARAYVAARAVPTPRPMPPEEPAVLSPEPPLYSGAGSGAGRPARDLEVPRKVEPESMRPVTRRPAEERTVHTGRRALVRNLVTVVASSAAVAVMMTTIMRWKEAHRPHVPSEVVVLPAIAEETASGAQVSAPPTEVAVPPAAQAQVETVPIAAVLPAPVASATEVAPAVRVAKPAGAQKRGKGSRSAAAAESLDDLNRQIRH